MKVAHLTSAALTANLLSLDPVERNKGFKALYLNPMIQATIRDWVRFYQLNDREPSDILQEGIILLDGILRDGGFRGDSKVETFLLGICKNLIRTGSKKVNKIQLKETLTDADLLSADQIADQLVLVEQHDLEAARDAAIRHALSQLTEKCQESMKLYYFENKNMKQVAAERNLANEGQAKKNMARCRENLRDLLKADENLQKILAQIG